MNSRDYDINSITDKVVSQLSGIADIDLEDIYEAVEENGTYDRLDTGMKAMTEFYQICANVVNLLGLGYLTPFIYAAADDNYTRNGGDC